jgi:hypothetical protein
MMASAAEAPLPIADSDIPRDCRADYQEIIESKYIG